MKLRQAQSKVGLGLDIRLYADGAFITSVARPHKALAPVTPPKRYEEVKEGPPTPAQSALGKHAAQTPDLAKRSYTAEDLAYRGPSSPVQRMRKLAPGQESQNAGTEGDEDMQSEDLQLA